MRLETSISKQPAVLMPHDGKRNEADAPQEAATHCPTHRAETSKEETIVVNNRESWRICASFHRAVSARDRFAEVFASITLGRFHFCLSDGSRRRSCGRPSHSLQNGVKPNFKSFGSVFLLTFN